MVLSRSKKGGLGRSVERVPCQLATRSLMKDHQAKSGGLPWRDLTVERHWDKLCRERVLSVAKVEEGPLVPVGCEG